MNTNKLPFIWTSGFGPRNELRVDMDRLFDEYWARPTDRTSRDADLEWAPACDIEEEQNHFLLTLDMPGVQKENIKLEVINDQLMISGERRHVQKSKAAGVWYSERRHGKLSRSLTLPKGVDPDKVEANYQDGTLRVYVPKSESAKPRQIKINNGSGTGFFGRLIGQSSSKEKEERLSSNSFDREKTAS